MSEHQLVVFELARNHYAVSITEVREILRVAQITRLPNMPRYVEGVINLRGKVISIFNLRSRLGLENAPADQDTRIVLVTTGGKTFGLIVDRVLEVSTYAEQDLERPEGLQEEGGFLQAIVKRRDDLWMLLDLARIA